MSTTAARCSISADGRTLAVGAQRMNVSGATYVYTMPDGDGEAWSDLEYADGVKVTSFVVPAWGTSSSRPFNSAASGRTGANSDCDAY